METKKDYLNMPITEAQQKMLDDATALCIKRKAEPKPVLKTKRLIADVRPEIHKMIKDYCMKNGFYIGSFCENACYLAMQTFGKHGRK